MKKFMCVALILCLGLSDFAMARGGGGAGGGGAPGVGGAADVSGGGWYGGYVGDTGGRRNPERAKEIASSRESKYVALNTAVVAANQYLATHLRGISA